MNKTSTLSFIYTDIFKFKKEKKIPIDINSCNILALLYIYTVITSDLI